MLGTGSPPRKTTCSVICDSFDVQFQERVNRGDRRRSGAAWSEVRGSGLAAKGPQEKLRLLE